MSATTPAAPVAPRPAAAARRRKASGRPGPPRAAWLAAIEQARWAARVDAVECSWRWAEDIKSGRAMHSGGAKVTCVGHGGRPGCGRLVPPQDVVVDPSAAPWPPAPDVQGPPPPPARLCTDCRTRAWEPRDACDHTVERVARLDLVGLSRLGEYAAVEYACVADDDGSPTSAALAAMSERGTPVARDDRLPDGGHVACDDDGPADHARANADAARLADALIDYCLTAPIEGIESALRKFEDLTGETAANRAQARRHGVARQLVV